MNRKRDKLLSNVAFNCKLWALRHGYWYKAPHSGAAGGWECCAPAGTGEHIARWMAIVAPILQQYTEATDGSFVIAKETSVVWHYRDADPDFGTWQAKAGRCSCSFRGAPQVHSKCTPHAFNS